MAYGDVNQLEHHLTRLFKIKKPWQIVSRSCGYAKLAKHRKERRRAKQNPECFDKYKRYDGWEW
jgi:hypothetical protein